MGVNEKYISLTVHLLVAALLIGAYAVWRTNRNRDSPKGAKAAKGAKETELLDPLLAPFALLNLRVLISGCAAIALAASLVIELQPLQFMNLACVRGGRLWLLPNLWRTFGGVRSLAEWLDEHTVPSSKALRKLKKAVCWLLLLPLTQPLFPLVVAYKLVTRPDVLRFVSFVAFLTAAVATGVTAAMTRGKPSKSVGDTVRVAALSGMAVTAALPLVVGAARLLPFLKDGADRWLLAGRELGATTRMVGLAAAAAVAVTAAVASSTGKGGGGEDAGYVAMQTTTMAAAVASMLLLETFRTSDTERMLLRPL
jgi:hypothetical protein